MYGKEPSSPYDKATVVSSTDLWDLAVELWVREEAHILQGYCCQCTFTEAMYLEDTVLQETHKNMTYTTHAK